MTHLREDGGFLSRDVDPGASSEDQVLNKQGRSIRQIARETRNTVRRYLREGRPIRYGPREPRPCKLDAYTGFLQKRIAQARPDWILRRCSALSLSPGGQMRADFTVIPRGRDRLSAFVPTLGRGCHLRTL